LAKAVFTDLAKSDLNEIWSHISNENASAADAVIERIREAAERLADNPFLGRSRMEFGIGLRSFPGGKYIIFYLPSTDGIIVARILDCRRDLNELFS
jgi:toxin ParE1/3/4